MLKLILALLPLAVHVSAQQQASPKPAPAIQGIPSGAVKIDENTYRFQEKDSSGKPGKVWLFRRNPFGVSKVEEKEAAKIGLSLAAPETPATATDLGESYRFERSGPFGAKIWIKRKSELTAEERAIAEKAVRPASSHQKAAN